MLIETFADLICPWCYIGRHRLKRALARRAGITATLAWRPFQLFPDLPREGMDRRIYLTLRGDSGQNAQVAEATAAAEHLPLDLSRVRRLPNTTNAHRLILLAERAGRGADMVDALFRAHFSEGADIGDMETLEEIAGTLGFDPVEVGLALAGDAELGNVRASDLVARHMGLQAVPCFVFERRFALSGAQEPECFLPLIDAAAIPIGIEA